MKISVCGKGGSGKSTLVSLLSIEALKRDHSVLVIDSDESNSTLFRMLGFEKPPVPLMELIGGKSVLKEKMIQNNVLSETRISTGDIPDQYLQRRDGLMLISIGKILHSLEGCACPMGALSREFLKKLHLVENEISIMDMEAGIEHFGRGVDTGIDSVLVVVEPSLESLVLAERIKGLTEGIEKDLRAVLNKIDSDILASRLRRELETRGIDVIGIIPNDPMIFEACLEGQALRTGEASSAAGKVLEGLLQES
jgi:CO dehydrogenase maturation factor